MNLIWTIASYLSSRHKSGLVNEHTTCVREKGGCPENVCYPNSIEAKWELFQISRKGVSMLDITYWIDMQDCPRPDGPGGPEPPKPPDPPPDDKD